MSGADDTAVIRQIFTDQTQTAKDLVSDAKADIQKAWGALQSSGTYAYDPYNWEIPPQPLIGGISVPAGPTVPTRPSDPKEPTLVGYNINVPNPNFGTAPTDVPVAPTITLPQQPSGEPGDTIGTPPTVGTPTFPGAPAFLALPNAGLPYPSVSLPTAPTLIPPSFTGVEPGDIQSLTLAEYLAQLQSSFDDYSQRIPALVQNNALTWFRAILNENPNVRVLDTVIATYLTYGGAGIPVSIEEAIVTRATDRLNGEYTRAVAEVWDEVASKGLTLPSGALQSGRKGARATKSEGVAKAATDVAIKNLELEHDHMKFMMQIGVQLQTMLTTLATDSAKIMVECNGQAVEVTKTILSGMIEIQNMLVKVYLAKWDGYRANVEAFKAKIQANEALVELYTAEIKGELAKTEVNRATVDILTAMVNGNRALAEMYKSQVDAETAKVEADRVRVMAFEAQVRAYQAKVEAYRAKWDGYRAGVDGQLAVARVYESQMSGFKGKVDAFTANVEAYRAQVQGYTGQVQAVSTQNEAALKAWGIQWDGTMKAYATSVDAYGRNWSALGEQMRAEANVLGVQGEFLARMYSTQTQIEIERSREHFSQWQARVRAALDAAEGLKGTAAVAQALAGSALNSMTAFAGTLATSQA